MIDGSEIKARRGAAGLSQQALADKVGTTQQTIDKIERGVMRRTTYLPEIQQALSAEGINPNANNSNALGAKSASEEITQVLNIALACGADGAKLLKALDVAGYKVISKSASAAELLGFDKYYEDPVKYVRSVLERRDISANKLATECKIAPSTLNRALNDPKHKCVLSTRTLRKIKEWDADVERMIRANEEL